MNRLRCIINRPRSRPLNLDLTVETCPCAFHQSRYNSLSKARVCDAIRWTASPPDRRASIVLHLIERSSFSHVICIFKNRVELSPTRRKSKKTIWFIRCDEYEGLASFEYGMLICTITLSNKIYIMYTSHSAT